MKTKKFIGVIVLVFLLFGIWLYRVDFSRGKTIKYGVNFSQKYASELGLDWKEVYLAILNDLGAKKLRLMAYWDLIEKESGVYDFNDLDWQLSQAEKHNAEVILTIGQRVPRWPECHWPGWAKKLSRNERQENIIKLLKIIVNHYKNNKAIIAWQVENEPFLKVFGECPGLDKSFYKQEINLVCAMDKRPIIITESGELSTWLRGARLADYVGTSVYRITWNKYWGYFHYPYPAAYYFLKTQLVKLLTPVKGVIVTEMQMEPWTGKLANLGSLKEQYHSMNLKQFQKNFKYAQKTGLSPIYFWGAEWWYWLKQQGNDSIWQMAQKIPF